MVKIEQSDDAKRWIRYFNSQVEKDGGLMPHFVSRMAHERLFLQIIVEYANRLDNPKILEVGCGSALHSIYLSFIFNYLTGVDLYPEVVNLARDNNHYLHGRANIIKGDIFSLDRAWDIIFSWGVYEHFDENRILKLLKLHLEYSKYLIFVVPSKSVRRNRKTAESDERLFSYRKWEKLIKLGGGKVVQRFGIGYKFRPFNVANYQKKLSGFLFPFAYNVGLVSTKRRKS